MPDRCALCARGPTVRWAPGLCAACAEGCRPPRAPSCRRCGEPWTGSSGCGRCRRFGAAFAFHGAAALWRYRGSARELIRAVKYGRLPLWPALGRALADAPRVAGLVAGGEVAVVPVPSTPEPFGWRRERHGERLAEAVAARLGVPFVPGAVRYAVRRGVRRQSRASTAERVQARRHAYVAREAPRRVLLVDDVMSTGATLDGCARALVAAGTATVHAAVVAT